MLYIGNVESSVQEEDCVIWKRSLGLNENRHPIVEGVAQGSARVIRNRSVHFGFEGIGGGFLSVLLLLEVSFHSECLLRTREFVLRGRLGVRGFSHRG